jgi:hypothetical protein
VSRLNKLDLTLGTLQSAEDAIDAVARIAENAPNAPLIKAFDKEIADSLRHEIAAYVKEEPDVY